MRNLSNFRIPIRIALLGAAAGIALSGPGCRETELDDGTIRGFHLSTGWNIPLNELQKDTTINIIVTSDTPWTAENSCDWATLNVTQGGQRTSLLLTVKRNFGISDRNTAISFRPDGREPYELKIDQLGAAPQLRIEQNKKIELDYNPQDFTVEVFSNLDLEHGFEAGGEDFYDVSLTKDDDYTYRFQFSCPANEDTRIHAAKYLLCGTYDGGKPLRDTIYLSQMYHVETLRSEIENSDRGLIVSWDKAANPAVQYYELRITDPDSRELAVIDVSETTAGSDTPSYDLSALDLFANAYTQTAPCYFGEIAVRVVAKVQKTDEAILAMGETLRSHSHFAEGTGSSSAPYGIANSRHLNNIGKLWTSFAEALQSAHFKQISDIALPDPAGISEPGAAGYNLEIIATNNLPFNGTYDGGNHCISNVYISSANVLVAPFAQVGKGGTVKDLRVAVDRIQGDAVSTTNVGGIAALNQGLIENCHVEGMDAYSVIYCPNNAGRSNVATVYNGFCGGIAGAIDNGTDAGGNASILRCSNACLIVGLTTTGGIVGGTHNAMNAGKVTVSYCYNTGDVYGGYPGDGITLAGNITLATDSSNQTIIGAAGGIFGRVDYNGNLGNYSIDHCFNSGRITTDNILGGIGGKIQRALINHCYNAGEVIQTRNAANTNVATGGICGHINPAITGLFISNSYNAGTIKSAAGNAYCGLICGNKGANPSITNVVGLADASGTPDAVMGVKTKTDNVTGKILGTPDEMQSLANFYDTFSSDIWVVNPGLSPAAYPYPQLVGLPHADRTTY